jgi:hypothetical protein
MSDRTGEPCPFCKKGKLYPTGERDFVEPAETPKSGEARRESTEYECDKCHRKTKGLGISLTATITTAAGNKVGDGTKKTKKQPRSNDS